MNMKTKPDVQEKVAMVVAGAIVLGSIIYWIVQIMGVLETLEMAYG